MAMMWIEVPTPPAGPAKTDAERRESRRTKVLLNVRVRPADPRAPEEVQPIRDFSRGGLYFTTLRKDYYSGQQLEIFFPYCATNRVIDRSSYARVARVERLDGSTWGVAVAYALR
jgi:hypothetical protein